MGFSIAASHIIFFIAVVAISAGVVTVFSDYIDQAKGAMTDKQSRLTGQLKTDVEIVNVYFDSSTDPDTLHVYSKNVGTKVLATDCMNLFIDGAYVELAASDITDPSSGSQVSEWSLEQTIKIDASQDLASDIHTAKLITCNGESDTHDFSN